MHKKLGRGIEELSQLFISETFPREEVATKEPMPDTAQAVSGTATRFITILSPEPDLSRNTFLACNLAVTLSRLGMRIGIVEINPSLPCREFFAADQEDAARPQMLKEGPLGIRLVNFSRHFAKTELFVNSFPALIESAQRDFDLVLLPASREGLNLAKFAPFGDAFLIIVPGSTAGMIDAYAMLKTVAQNNKTMEIGLVIDGTSETYRSDAIFAKMAEMASRYINKEVLPYGNLCQRLKNAALDAHPVNAVSIYDAELHAAISNIAQVIILRMNVQTTAAAPGLFFERLRKVISEA